MNLLLSIIGLILMVALSVSENHKAASQFDNSLAAQSNFGGNYK
jgi:hypothetical protein